MNAVLLAKHTPNPDGLPADWPVETRPLAAGETVVAPWQMFSDPELAVLLSDQAAAKADWNLAREAPTPVPESVTPRQIRRALTAFGLRATVEAAIAGADQATRDDWEFALEIRRDWPALTAMATQMNLTSEQVDALFVQAATY
jgi:hypothetical protein